MTPSITIQIDLSGHDPAGTRVITAASQTAPVIAGLAGAPMPTPAVSSTAGNGEVPTPFSAGGSFMSVADASASAPTPFDSFQVASAIEETAPMPSMNVGSHAAGGAVPTPSPDHLPDEAGNKKSKR